MVRFAFAGLVEGHGYTSLYEVVEVVNGISQEW
jgi:hypothetical protein